MSTQQILLHVLEITNYPQEERESYSNRLIALAGQAAFGKYLKNLSPEKLKEVREQIKGKKPEESAEMFRSYLVMDSFKKLFSKEIDLIIADYIREMSSELTKEQKQQLKEFLEKLMKS